MVVKGLVKDYKLDFGIKVRALDHLNFSVEKGEILGVLGESGSGKTTLIRVLRGVEPFDEGEIIVGNIKTTSNSGINELSKAKEISAIHIQRSFGLWSESVLDNVIRALSSRMKGEETIPVIPTEYKQMKKEAIEILRMVDLDHKLDCWAEVLSGGEKQKLLLARQLARRPQFLLLDEPGTMVDEKGRGELLKAIKRINRELNTTVICVSHMPKVHRYLADRVIWLSKGKITYCGLPEKALRRFESKMDTSVPKPLLKEIKPILKVENVSKEYYVIPGRQTLLMENISFQVYEGEILAIIGPSAVGKTVLIRSLTGLELPDEGNVKIRMGEKWVNLNTIGYDSILARRDIGILHQEFDFPYWARVVDLFAERMGLKTLEHMIETLEKAKSEKISDKMIDLIYRIMDLPPHEAEKRLMDMGLTLDDIRAILPKYPVQEVAEKVGLLLESLRLSEDVLNRRVYELSWGEKIRIGLGLLMVCEPKVLLLDEPFGDLDSITLRRIANIVKDLVRETNSTIVLVSHQLDFVKEVAHRAILLKDYKITFQGDPEKACELFLKEYGSQ
ncbi:MAG: ATP-binding cassette domain-containing protein [Candidatus Methylarchaceae archaeon HK02M1]|nr:ATP-binding cassette domain-containing protein [Candidatus Methylarchaceae archaeon HK02M1]